MYIDWVRTRKLSAARARRYRERKREEAKQLDSVAQESVLEAEEEQFEKEKSQQKGNLAKECSRRYRERNRLDTSNSVDANPIESEVFIIFFSSLNLLFHS